MNFRVFVIAGLIFIAVGTAPALAGETTGMEKTEAAKIVHTFTSEEEKKAFVGLIQSRKVVLTKMSVLQNLLHSQKEALEKIRGQLLLFYKVKQGKEYYLNQNSQSLVEVAAQEKIEKENATENVVYTFKSGKELQKFKALSRSLQSLITTASVIEGYMDQEKLALDQFNGLLLLKFQIDPSKYYNLDSGRNGIIELASPSEITM